jgi:hypothetical protein
MTSAPSSTAARAEAAIMAGLLSRRWSRDSHTERFDNQRYVPAIRGLCQLHRHDVRFSSLKAPGKVMQTTPSAATLSASSTEKRGSIGNGIVKDTDRAIDA